MNAIRRGEWASLHKKVKSSTGTRYVIGVGMVGTETCVTEGDLVCSEKRRLRGSELLSEGESRRGRGSEGSERFIVAMTPGESREQ